MRVVRLSDITMQQYTGEENGVLTFREKIDLACKLDRLLTDVIEIPGLSASKEDALRIKSAASAVEHSVLAVPVQAEPCNASAVWEALSGAAHPRLQVVLPVSTVQMEYLCHKKPADMLRLIGETVAACRALTEDVEFVAGDAAGSEEAFLAKALRTALEAGASLVTLSEDSGRMLPGEFAAFVRRAAEAAEVPTGKLGVRCSNALHMADACNLAAVEAGAAEVKTAVYPVTAGSLCSLAAVLEIRGETLGAKTAMNTAALKQTSGEIKRMFEAPRDAKSPFENGVRKVPGREEIPKDADCEQVLSAAAALGYELSGEDGQTVYEAFRELAATKQTVTVKELDALIATAAMQVPPTYRLETYSVNCAGTSPSMAYVCLSRQGKRLEGISMGNGPIDAAFLAIEQTVGRHFELDDFQIQSVTEGREAMGQTLVKLRCGGRLYAGQGVSTDIIASGIHAYLNALNKIVYGEAE